MFDIITSTSPDVRPAVSRPSATYPHPSVFNVAIARADINDNPSVKLQMRNFRMLVDDENNPIMLPDGVTQKSEYSPMMRIYNIDDLYAWITVQPNAMELVGALNTLITSLIAWDEEQKIASSSSSSSE